MHTIDLGFVLIRIGTARIQACEENGESSMKFCLARHQRNALFMRAPKALKRAFHPGRTGRQTGGVKSGLKNVFTLCLALLQLMTAPVASIADAWQDAATAGAQPYVHIESQGAPDCPRVHPAVCALCQVIQASVTPARTTELWAGTATDGVSCIPADHGSVKREPAPQVRPRAPPTS